MAEQLKRVQGIGYSVVDVPVKDTSIRLPSTHKEAIDFASRHSAVRAVGGSVTNIMTTFVRYTGRDDVGLFSAVGKDASGDFYEDRREPRLGRLQRSPKPTGIYAALVDDAGNIVDKTDPFYGAAEDVVFEREKVGKMELLIINGNLLSNDRVVDQVKQGTDVLEETDGLLAFNLSGIASERTTRERMETVFEEGLRTKPHIVMGNLGEAQYVTGESSPETALEALYDGLDPHNRLAAVTLDREGSLIHHRGVTMHIPVENELMTDVHPVGAGDTYMGVMLAQLLDGPLHERTHLEVETAARTASFAASRVVRIPETRLAPGEFVDVKAFRDTLKSA